VVQLDKLAPDYEERIRHGAALCFLPLYHAFSQGYFISCFPHQRVPVYVMPQFDLAKMLGHIATLRITKLFAVPPILVLLSKHPLARGADLSSLRMIASGAAPLAKETQKEVSKLMPGGYEDKVRQGWGMTEVTCTALGWDPTTSAVAGVGELMPDCKAKLLSLESGEEILEPDVPGELYISAPTLMKGYWRNPEATQKAIMVDGAGTRWLRTGDIAYVSPDYDNGTLFHIVDRAKELVKVNGYQVSPSELDALLLEREDIMEAAVIGVTINGEEMPRAYVVPKPGFTNTTGTEIQEWVAQRVARYKRLKGGVVFVEVIPKNPVCTIPSIEMRNPLN
jgi:4-coumarate--CoA ligase